MVELGPMDLVSIKSSLLVNLLLVIVDIFEEWLKHYLSVGLCNVQGIINFVYLLHKAS
jgi:heme/copper-type cytochrome/quinol oxidase subunit 4